MADNSSGGGAVLFSIPVTHGGVTSKLIVRMGDDPTVLANEFCASNCIDMSKVQKLASKIKSRMDTVIAERAAAITTTTIAAAAAASSDNIGDTSSQNGTHGNSHSKSSSSHNKHLDDEIKHQSPDIEDASKRHDDHKHVIKHDKHIGHHFSLPHSAAMAADEGSPQPGPVDLPSNTGSGTGSGSGTGTGTGAEDEEEAMKVVMRRPVAAKKSPRNANNVAADGAEQLLSARDRLKARIEEKNSGSHKNNNSSNNEGHKSQNSNQNNNNNLNSNHYDINSNGSSSSSSSSSSDYRSNNHSNHKMTIDELHGEHAEKLTMKHNDNASSRHSNESDFEVSPNEKSTRATHQANLKLPHPHQHPHPHQQDSAPLTRPPTPPPRSPVRAGAKDRGDRDKDSTSSSTSTPNPTSAPASPDHIHTPAAEDHHAHRLHPGQIYHQNIHQHQHHPVHAPAHTTHSSSGSGHSNSDSNSNSQSSHQYHTVDTDDQAGMMQVLQSSDHIAAHSPDSGGAERAVRESGSRITPPAAASPNESVYSSEPNSGGYSPVADAEKHFDTSGDNCDTLSDINNGELNDRGTTRVVERSSSPTTDTIYVSNNKIEERAASPTVKSNSDVNPYFVDNVKKSPTLDSDFLTEDVYSRAKEAFLPSKNGVSSPSLVKAHNVYLGTTKDSQKLYGKSAGVRLFLSASITMEKKEKAKKVEAERIRKEQSERSIFRCSDKSRELIGHNRNKEGDFGSRMYEEAIREKEKKEKLINNHSEVLSKIDSNTWSCAKCGTFHNISKTEIVEQCSNNSKYREAFLQEANHLSQQQLRSGVADHRHTISSSVDANVESDIDDRGDHGHMPSAGAGAGAGSGDLEPQQLNYVSKSLMSRVCSVCNWDQGSARTFEPVNVAYKETVDNLKSGSAKPSWVTRYDNQNKPDPDSTDAPKNVFDALQKNAKKYIHTAHLKSMKDNWSKEESENTFHPKIPDSSKALLAYRSTKQIDLSTDNNFNNSNNYNDDENENDGEQGGESGIGNNNNNNNSRVFGEDHGVDRLSSSRASPPKSLSTHERLYRENLRKSFLMGKFGENDFVSNDNVTGKSRTTKDSDAFFDRMTYDYKRVELERSKLREKVYAADPKTGQPLFKPKVAPPPPEYHFTEHTKEKKTIFESLLDRHQHKMRKDEEHAKHVIDMDMKAKCSDRVAALPQSNMIVENASNKSIVEMFRLLVAIDVLETTSESSRLWLNNLPEQLKSVAISETARNKGDWADYKLDIMNVNISLMIGEVQDLLFGIRDECRKLIARGKMYEGESRLNNQDISNIDQVDDANSAAEKKIEEIENITFDDDEEHNNVDQGQQAGGEANDDSEGRVVVEAGAGAECDGDEEDQEEGDKDDNNDYNRGDNDMGENKNQADGDDDEREMLSDGSGAIGERINNEILNIRDDEFDKSSRLNANESYLLDFQGFHSLVHRCLRIRHTKYGIGMNYVFRPSRWTSSSHIVNGSEPSDAKKNSKIPRVKVKSGGVVEKMLIEEAQVCTFHPKIYKGSEEICRSQKRRGNNPIEHVLYEEHKIFKKNLDMLKARYVKEEKIAMPFKPTVHPTPKMYAMPKYKVRGVHDVRDSTFGKKNNVMNTSANTAAADSDGALQSGVLSSPLSFPDNGDNAGTDNGSGGLPVDISLDLENESGAVNTRAPFGVSSSLLSSSSSVASADIGSSSGYKTPQNGSSRISRISNTNTNKILSGSFSSSFSSSVPTNHHHHSHNNNHNQQKTIIPRGLAKQAPGFNSYSRTAPAHYESAVESSPPPYGGHAMSTMKQQLDTGNISKAINSSAYFDSAGSHERTPQGLNAQKTSMAINKVVIGNTGINGMLESKFQKSAQYQQHQPPPLPCNVAAKSGKK